MKQLTEIEKRVMQLIPMGSGRKASIREVCEVLNIDERAAYELISRLRKKGIPICAKRNGPAADRGYYIATSEQERADGLAPYKSQVHEMMIIIRQIEGADIDQWRSEGEKIR